MVVVVGILWGLLSKGINLALQKRLSLLYVDRWDIVPTCISFYLIFTQDMLIDIRESRGGGGKTSMFERT